MVKFRQITLLNKLFISIFLCLIGVIYLQKHRLFERLWFNMQNETRAAIWQDQSLWLTDYQAVIQAKKIAGVANLSGLTYNPNSNTLYTISNHRPEVIELSLEGDIIRRIDANLFHDPEAIEYIDNNIYAVADEFTQRVSLVEITDTTQSIDHLISTLTIGFEFVKNKSFEGLVYHPGNNELLVAKEKNPIRLYKIKGFYNTNVTNPPLSLVVDHQDKIADNLFITDISGLEIDKKRDHYLVLSHESKILLELNRHGESISSLSLYKWQHGLNDSIPQAEGVALSTDEVLYIISEPNLFYKFQKYIADK